MTPSRMELIKSMRRIMEAKGLRVASITGHCLAAAAWAEGITSVVGSEVSFLQLIIQIGPRGKDEPRSQSFL